MSSRCRDTPLGIDWVIIFPRCSRREPTLLWVMAGSGPVDASSSAWTIQSGFWSHDSRCGSSEKRETARGPKIRAIFCLLSEDGKRHLGSTGELQSDVIFNGNHSCKLSITPVAYHSILPFVFHSNAMQWMNQIARITQPAHTRLLDSRNINGLENSANVMIDFIAVLVIYPRKPPNL